MAIFLKAIYDCIRSKLSPTPFWCPEPNALPRTSQSNPPPPPGGKEQRHSSQRCRAYRGDTHQHCQETCTAASGYAQKWCYPTILERQNGGREGGKCRKTEKMENAVRNLSGKMKRELFVQTRVRGQKGWLLRVNPRRISAPTKGDRRNRS